MADAPLEELLALALQSHEARQLWQSAVERLRVVLRCVEYAAATRRRSSAESVGSISSCGDSHSNNSDSHSSGSALLQQQRQRLQHAQEQLRALVARAARRLRHVATADALLERLTDSRRRLAWLRDLHDRLDEIVATTRLQHADVGQSWRSAWAADCEAMEAQLSTELLGGGAWLEQLRESPARQREALVTLRLAIAKSKSEGETKPEDRAVSSTLLLQQAFRKVLSLAGVAVPSTPPWQLLPSELTIDKRHALPGGRGVHVHRATWGPEDTPVIVKQAGHPGDRLAPRLEAEATHWHRFDHPNVLRLLGGSCVSSPPFLVLENTERSMDDALLLDGQASATVALHWLLQAARGLAYLHDTHQVVHGDLQLAHLYVDAGGAAKIAALSGFFCVASSNQDRDDGDSGTALDDDRSLRWEAPERLQDLSAPATPASDVFAFGVCMWEALSHGELPWGTASDASVRDRVLQGERLPRPPGSDVSDGLWALLQATWQADPAARPSMAALVSQLQPLVVCSDGAKAKREDGACTRSLHRRPTGTSRDEVDIDELESLRFTTLSSLLDAPCTGDDSLSTPPSYAVTLHQHWLGVRVNSIGRHVVVSRFVWSADGEQGELERSGLVRLGDVLRAVNGRSVAGMDRQQVGAMIQRTRRPVELMFERDPELLAECLQFDGLDRLRATALRCCDQRSVVPLNSSLEQLLGPAGDAFTVGAWFSLSDKEDVVFGGVLLGAQDARWDDALAGPPLLHEPLLMVDARGDLSCSFVCDDRPVRVQSDLFANRWYHVAVSFCGEMLSVFVDGVLRHHAPASPRAKAWAGLRHVNVGTGYTSRLAHALAVTEPKAAAGGGGGGWYDFHGLVSDVAVWRHALSDTQVQQLVRGADDCVAPPAFGLRRDQGKTVMRATRRVLASRPHHVVAQTYG
ncbi:hypothetical protein ATCC90586_002912 [Pythium insidiosum]|nr:hypothetical protein ATCC90586_002912 [Pythium insidiosum]